MSRVNSGEKIVQVKECISSHFIISNFIVLWSEYTIIETCFLTNTVRFPPSLLSVSFH